MSRFNCGLAALLLASAAWTAPAPQPYVVGLGNPIDPDKDCKFVRVKRGLTIEMTGKDHDFDPRRDCFNAPRLLRDIEGDFTMEVKVSIDCRLSDGSTVKGNPPMASGGFLVIPPDKSCIRLEFLVDRKDGETQSHAALKDRPPKLGKTDYVWDRRYKTWPLPDEADHAYLRLERRGDKFYPYVSPDGEKWLLLVGSMGVVGLPAKLKVGLAAYSTSTEPAKVRFEEFKLTRGRKKER